MKSGMFVMPTRETKGVSIFVTPPGNPQDLGSTNVESPQSLFCDSDRVNKLLFEVNLELRLGRIARSRREGACFEKTRAVNYLWLVCVDGEAVDAPNQHCAVDREYLAEVAALRAWLDAFGRTLGGR
jgi:hypothetical protein